MDPGTFSSLAASIGSGLITVLTTLGGIGIAEPLVSLSIEQLVRRFSERLDRQEAREELRKAIETAVADASGSSEMTKWEKYQWIMTLLKLGADKSLSARVVAAAIEMTELNEQNIPVKLKKDLHLKPEEYYQFAKFLFTLRKALANIDSLSECIKYADRLHSSSKLAGLYELVAKAIVSTEDGRNYILTKEWTPSKSELEDRYLRNFLNEYEGLFLEGRSRDHTIRPDSQLRLAQVYTSLNTKHTRLSKLTEEQRIKLAKDGIPAPEKIHVPLSCLRMIMEARRVLILGDPGSGKTTFIQFLCLCLAGSRLDSRSDWPQRLQATDVKGWELLHFPLPLFIKLRLFANDTDILPDDPGQIGRAEYLLEYLQKELAGLGFAGSDKYLLELIDEEQILIVLDGLDEVAHPKTSEANDERRKMVAQSIQNFHKRYPRARIIVTCRNRQYPLDADDQPTALWKLDGFALAKLQDFDDAQISDFVSRWFDELAAKSQQLANKLNYASKKETLKKELANGDLIELARKPILLTQIALLHAYGKVANSRVQLFKECTDLLLWDWERLRAIQSGRQDILATDYLNTLVRGLRVNEVEDALDRAVFLAHQHGEPEISKDRIRDAIRDLLVDVYGMQPYNAIGPAERFVFEWLYKHNALFVPASDSSFDFPHRSFREFMVGRYLRENSIPEADGTENDWKITGPRLIASDLSMWGEAYRFAVGLAESPVEVAASINEVLQPEFVFENEIIEQLLLAGEIACESGGIILRVRSKIGAQLYERLVTQLINLMRDTQPGNKYPSDTPNPPATSLQRASLQTRLRAGELLSTLGWIPPDLEDFIKIEDEKAVFWVSKYPITNYQYQRFLDSEDYRDPEIWNSIIGYESDNLLLKNVGEMAYEWFKQDKEPSLTEGQSPRFANSKKIFPAVGVTWYEAAAYCSWFTRHWKEFLKTDKLPDNMVFRLPLDWEWGIAAGGLTSNRSFPWQLDLETEVPFEELKTRINVQGNQLLGTTPVCMYPLGSSRKDVMDMSGNVWEWQANIARNDEMYRGLKGGAWSYDSDYATINTQLHAFAKSANNNIGFRIIGYQEIGNAS